MNRERSVPALLALALGVAGCGDPGLPPGAEIANRTGQDLQVFLQEARAERTDDGRTPGYTVGAAGDWKVVAFEPPRRGFRIMTPPGMAGRPGFSGRIQAPTRVLVFNEGRDRVILHPQGAPVMAFEFHVPDSMRLARLGKSASPGAIHFPGAEVWVARDGQDIELEWTGRETPGWLGDLKVHDAYGREVPLEGQLDLPAGWVGVPSGMSIFRIGIDRAYGPYQEAEPGIWTSVDDPYPLAVTLLPGMFVEITQLLGPRPGRRPDLVIESCGECTGARVWPAGAGDQEVVWMRLGTPDLLATTPGPLAREPLRTWIRTSPRDPTGHALLAMYAQLLFPIPQATLLGLQFLPPPSLSRPLPELMRRWTTDTPGQDARALVKDVLPSILFECRAADPEGFDRAIRNLIHRGHALLFADLVAELRRVATRSLAPLQVRGLLD